MKPRYNYKAKVGMINCDEKVWEPIKDYNGEKFDSN